MKAIRQYVSARMRGAGLCIVIALAASSLSAHYGAPVMLFALLLGMAFHFLSEEKACTVGIEFCSTTLLRIGVALLGAQVSFDQLASLGTQTLVLTPALVVATIGAGVLFARIFGRSTQFGLLAGGAVAVCGASAALAIAAVLPKTETSERDTLFTVVAVTALSTVAMIVYPLLFSSLNMSEAQTGFLIGATIHDVAQVVGAGYAVSPEAGDIAVFVKLLRVAMLPVIVLALSLFHRGSTAGPGGVPIFVIAFAVLMLVNSLGLMPDVVTDLASIASRWMLIAAIAALGVKTSLKSVASLGARHMVVVVAATVFLAAAAVTGLWLG